MRPGALLIPTGSEVFGTSHYAFWWGTMLLFPPLLWATGTSPRPAWPRVAMTLLGGLSSPLVVAIAPLFVVRAFRYRAAREYAVTATALICAAVQAWMLATSGTHGTHLPSEFSPAVVIAKFFGIFVIGAASTQVSNAVIFAGLALLLALLLSVVGARRTLAWRHVAIAGALLLSVLVSSMRVPPESMHPVFAGERYFFYPYVLLAWLIIELAPLCSLAFRWIFLFVLVAASLQFFGFGRRHHEAIDWRGQLAACAQSKGPYPLPVHYDGQVSRVWHVELTAAQCRGLIDRSVFGALPARQSAPIRIMDNDPPNPDPLTQE